MKAIQFCETGGVEVLMYCDVPVPSPGPGQVLIKNQSISVNFADVMMRRGTYPMMPSYPITPGLEAAGVVEKLGQGVTGLQPDQRVVALGQGAYAQYMVTDASAVYPIPDHVDIHQAAALPINYLTAYHTLHTMGCVQPGQFVLNYAAAGGVGTAVIQLGKLADVIVIGLTSTGEKERYVAEQGCDHVINYKTDNLVTHVMDITHGKGANLILNSVAGNTFTKDFQMLAALGQIIWFGFADGPPDIDLLEVMTENFGKGVGFRVFHLLHSIALPYPDLMRRSTETLIDYLAQKKINPVIYERLSLAHASRAHQLLESRLVTGKLILIP